MGGLRVVEYQGNDFIDCDTDVQISTTLKRKTIDVHNKLEFVGKLNAEEVSGLNPLTLFINTDGSLSYKQMSGEIKKLTFV